MSGLTEVFSRRNGLRAAVAATALAATLAFTTTEASAWGRRHYGGAVAAGVLGGVALGALAARPYYRPYYGPAPVYADPYPAYYGPACYLETRRYWDGWGWRLRRIRVCD